MAANILYAFSYQNEEQLNQIKDVASGWAELSIINQKAPEADYRQHLERADFVIGYPKADWLEGTPVRVAQIGSAGFDPFIGYGLELRPNFTLCNARGVFSIGIAENTLAMMLGFSRRIPQHTLEKQNHQFVNPIYDSNNNCYGELNGSTVCVVGIGHSGAAVAQVCAGIQMRVIGVDFEGVKKPDCVKKLYTTDELQTALGEADHVVIATVGGPDTEGMVNKDFLNAMKPGAYLYNAARGTCVNEPDLIDALKSGHLAGAGLDVFREEPLSADNPIWDLGNVITTPHIAGFAKNFEARMGEIIIKNLNNYRNGLPLFNVVTELSTTDVHPKAG